MVRKHNPRDYSSHRYDIIRPYDEFYKVELFSYDHQYTRYYTVQEANVSGENFKTMSWKSWSVYASNDGKQNYRINCDYFVEKYGEYRVDLLYETSETTVTPLTGDFNGEETTFDGIIHELKRKTFFNTYDEGNITLSFSLPKNVYFIGVIIQKIVEYVGDSLDSAGTSLLLKDVDYSTDSQINPKEVSFKIAYDNNFENLLSQSGFYMDYNDEVNVYLKKDGENDEVRVFGGYLSSILPNDNKTELTISCADRMVDGQNNYILTRMRLLGGTKTGDEDVVYTTDMDQDFDTYGAALKYLCNCMETTLNNNIDKNDLVTNETAKKGFNVEFGKDKAIKKVTTKNCTAAFSKNYVTLRNNASAAKTQEIVLYNAKDHVTSVPPNITNYKNFGIVYGLGDPKTEHDEKSITVSDAGSGKAGSQTFSKCGVSADGKYLMAIGLPSACGEVSKYGYKYYKRIYKRKCICGSTNLVWDWHWNGTTNWGYSACRGNSEGGSAEGHIFCKSCDRDFSIITGKDHVSCGSKNKLEPATGISKSSESEARKLKNGSMSAVPGTGVTVTSDDVFSAITKKAFKYRYKLYGNTYSTAAGLKKHGYGDCWAFSEFIFNELKSYKVNCRVVQYATSEAPNGTHRSVQYKDKNNNWVDFPYRQYGWGTKYNNMLNNTAGSKNPNSVPFKYTAGGNIAHATSGGGGGTETTTIKVTNGYDRDKPIQGYFEVTVSTEPSLNAKTETVQVGFTIKPGTANSYTGFTPVWINNSVKQINIDLLKFIKESIYSDFDDTNEYYLHSIKFIAPINKTIDSEATMKQKKTVYKVEDWYTNDKSTKDNSSCKIDLYSINFNDYTTINPTDLESCGKSINTLFSEILSVSKYAAKVHYAKHRKDDSIDFSVDNVADPSFTAMEGDENNILKMSGISFTPRTNLYNNSTVVFKDNTQRYKYVDTRDVNSILRYGEQTTLVTSTDTIGSKEAYYNAMNNGNYNPSETFNFTITLPFFVDISVGELVKVISNNQHLNTIKEVKSVKYNCGYNQIPKVRTELGLGELPADLQVKKELREIRQSAKKETTTFSGTAKPIMDEFIYEWDN